MRFTQNQLIVSLHLNMSLKISLFLALITHHILLSASLYVPLLSPPRSGDGGTGMTLNILEKYPDLECEPDNPDSPPLAGIELLKGRKKLPKCPPGASRPVIAKLNPNITVKAGETIVIEIAYGGFPEPTLEYYRADTRPPQRVYETQLIKPFKRYEKLNATRVTDRGLYLIKAVNSEGFDSIKIYVDVLDRPSQPNGPLTATDITQNTMKLSWSPPDDNGGIRISRYVVEKYVPENTTWEFVLNTTKTEKVVGYLTPGQKYKFRVSAANKYGVSDPLEILGPVVALGRPSAPRNVIVIKNKDAYEVRWQPPKRDNGGEITLYLVESREVPNGAWNPYDPLPKEQSKFSVSGLQTVKSYEFRVSAINDAGVGEPSKVTSATEVPLQIPATIYSFDSPNKHSQNLLVAKQGDPITLEAVVGGEPEPDYQWKRNDKPINEILENINITAEGNRTKLYIASAQPNHIGNYSLRVSNSLGSDSASISLTIQLPTPSTPGGPIEVTNSTGDCLSVKWTPPSDSTGSLLSYIVEMLDSITNAYTQIGNTSDKPEINICGLKPNSDVKLRVKAVNSGGESLPLEGVVKTPSEKHSTPGPPLGPIELTSATSNSIQIKWFPSIDSPVEYIVEIYRPEATFWEPFGITNNTEFIANGLVGDKKYKFRIKAINLYGESEPITADFITPSLPVTPIIFTPIDTPPADFGPIESLKTNNDSIQLKWNESTNKTQPINYKVEKFNPITNSWEPIGSTTDTKLLISGLSPNTEYKFRVKSSNSAGDSPPIESGTLKTTGNRPDPPIGPIEVSSAGDNQIILSWKPPYDNGNAAKEYKVELQKENSDKVEITGKTPGIKNRINNLQSGQTYKIRVRAVNDFGESEPIETVYKMPTLETKSVPSPPDGQISASNINADGVTLAWNPPKNDGGEPVLVYKVEKLGENNRWEPVGESSSPKVMISGLTPGSKQKFRVIAVNKIGASAPLETDGVIALRSPPNAPGKPDISVINPNSVSLNWKPPNSDNGAKINNYVIEYVETGGPKQRRKRQTTQSDSSPKIKSLNTQNADTFARMDTLESGIEYKFRVRAVNDAGIGPPSEWSDVVTMPANSAAPLLKILSPVFTVKEGEPLIIEIPFTGLPIPQFFARKLDGGQPLLTDVSAGIIKISSPKVDAINGGKYILIAMNNIGKDQKIIEIIVTKKSTVPSIPTGPLSVTDITNTSAIIRWRAPISDGGERVNKYLVEKYDANTSIWDKIGETQTPGVKVNLLKPHQKYKFRVSAVNINGASMPLESDTIETLDNEIAPKLDRKNLRDVKVKAGEPIIVFVESSGQPLPKLKWNKLNEVQICDGNYETSGGLLSIKSAKRWHSGLYQITAQSSAGTDSAVIRVDIVDTPSTPSGPLTVTQQSDGKVLLQWQFSADNGSLPVEYLVEKFDFNTYQWIPVGKTRSTQHIATDPNINTYSRYRVSAINEAGKSYPLENSAPVIEPQTTQSPAVVITSCSSLQSNTTEERVIYIQVEDDETDDLRDLALVHNLQRPHPSD